MAPIGAPGINDAESAKKWKKSGNSSYLVLPLKASFAEKADLIAPSFLCVVAKDLVNLTTVMCAIKAVYGTTLV